MGFTAASAADGGQAQTEDRASCSGTKIYLNDDWGCVISYGDRMKISDQTWDGNGARLRWNSSRPNEHGKTSGFCRDYNGSENGTEECNYNFPEGTTISYKLEQISDGDVVDAYPWDYFFQAVV